MIKIVSGGTGGTTKVYGDDGSEIKGIQMVTWTLDAKKHGPNALASVTLVFPVTEVDVCGELDMGEEINGDGSSNT